MSDLMTTKAVSLVILPHQLGLGTRILREAKAGGSVAEILRSCDCGFLLDEDLPVAIDLDGAPVFREMWEHIQPRGGQVLTIRAMPGKSDSDTDRTILLAAVSLASMAVGNVAGPWIGAAVLIGGTLLVNSVVPPLLPKAIDINPSNVYRAGGSRNRFNPGGRLPVVLGGPIRVYPDHIIKPFTSAHGSNSYLYMMFGVCGPADISDVRIGDTPISQYQDVTYAVFTDSTKSPPSLGTSFQTLVSEEQTSIALEMDGPWVTRTFSDCEEIGFDLFFPEGCYKRRVDSNFGNEYLAESYIHMWFEYRKQGDSTWSRFDVYGDYLDFQARQPYLYQLVQQDSYYAPESWVENISPWSFYPPGAISFYGKITEPFWKSLRYIMPSRDNWEVRWRYVTVINYNPSSVKSLSISAIRTYRHDPPVVWDDLPPIAGVAVRIRSSGQLNGMIDQLNFLATGHGYLPDAEGNYAWDTAPAVYPPDCYLWCLRGPTNSKPVDESILDLETFSAWRDYCEEISLRIAAVVDYDTTLAEVLKDIASVGRASPSMRDNLHSVCVDQPKAGPVQTIAPVNSWNMRTSKILSDKPHAVNAKWRNPDADYAWDVRTVYADGYTEETATRRTDLELWGVTRPEQAYKAARFQLACGKLRPETVQVTMGADHLRCTRGDRVGLLHDVLMIGQTSGRIKSVTTDVDGNALSVTVAEKCAMADGVSYAMVIRLASGEIVTASVGTVAGEQDSLTFNAPIPVASAPAGGEVFFFGESGRVYEDMIVLQIEPGSDYTAKLTLCHYAEGVFASDTGVIPTFDTNITRPPALQNPAPPKPRILTVRSDEGMLLQAGSSLRPRIGITYSIPESVFVSGRYIPANQTDRVQVQIRQEGGVWRDIMAVPPEQHTIIIPDVEEGVFYDIRIRTVSPSDAASDWATVYAHTVVGKSSPPPNIDGLLVESGLLVWAYPNPPVDFAGFRVRYHYGDNAHWGSAAPAHDGLLTTAQFPLERLGGSGVRTVMVHAYDLSGNQSEVPAVVRLDLGNQVLRSILTTRKYEEEGFPGTIEGGLVSGDVLEAGSTSLFWRKDSTTPFWRKASDLFWGAIYTDMSYVFEYVPSKSALDGNIVLDLGWQGVGGCVCYRTGSRLKFWTDEPVKFWKGPGVKFWPSKPGWSPYPGRIGALRRQKYEFRLMITGGPTRPEVTRAWAYLDVPDIVETLIDIVVPDTGLRLPVEQTYRTIQSVQCTLLDDGGSAVVVKVMDKDKAGPLVMCLTAAGVATSGLIDATIKGN